MKKEYTDQVQVVFVKKAEADLRSSRFLPVNYS